KSLIDKTMKDMEKVLDFGYSPDGTKMIISGVLKGQSDLYLYNILSKSITKITDDIYDDMHPQFIDNGERVIFSSNRPSDTIFKKPEIDFIDRKNDLYIYDLKQHGRNYIFLERITDTEEENEIEPYEMAPGKYIYLNNKNGLYNRFIAEK